MPKPDRRQHEPPPAAAKRWHVWACAAALLVIVALAHCNDLWNGFNYDDEANIVGNTGYRGFGSTQLHWMFTTFLLGHYQPLSWMSLALDYTLWGERPFGYHLTNLILHLGSALLVFAIGLELLGTRTAPLPHKEGVGGGSRSLAALLAALLFAVHPLRVESVAWVTERRDVLSSFFLLFSVLCYLYAHGSGARRYRFWIGCSWAVFLLSLLSRAMGMTLPVLLLLLDLYPLRRLGSVGAGWRTRAAVRIYLEKLPYAIPAAACAVLAPIAQHVTGATLSLAEHGVMARGAQALYGLMFYLWKTAVPTGLSPLYELELPLAITSSKYIVAAILVVGFAALVLWRARRWPGLAVVGAMYAILLLPVLGFVQSGRQEVADRYSYLPAIPWALLIAAGVQQIWLRRRRSVGIVTVIAAIAVAALGALTWQQSRVWRTPLSLWEHAVRCAPGITTHQNYAAALAQVDRFEEAAAHYRAALKLEPLHQKSLRGLAKALSDSRQFEAAAPVWEELVQRAPEDEKAWIQLGLAQRARGASELAIEAFQAAAALTPPSVEALTNLADLLMDLQRWGEATKALQQAAALEPRRADFQYNLGNCLAQAGDLPGSLRCYETALAITPGYVEARNNLGVTLERMGRGTEALAAYEAVLSAQPRHVVARYNRSRVLLQLGRRDEALRDLRELLRIQPDHAEARRALAVLEGQGAK
jgi:protein O-mannosyl-transferase